MKKTKEKAGIVKRTKDYVLGNIMILVCTLSGWTETCDEDGNIAGIDAMWLAHGDEIDDITYGVNGEVTTITMATDKYFVKHEFPEDIGFLNQPLAVNKGNQSIKQVLNFTNYKFRQALRNAISNMLACALCGDLVIIVRDNNSRYWLCGVKKTSTGFIIKGFKAVSSDGAKTGTNSESDSNEVTIQLEAKVGEFTREFTGDVTELTADAPEPFDIPVPVYSTPTMEWPETDGGPFVWEIYSDVGLTTLVESGSQSGLVIDVDVLVAGPGTYYFRVKNSAANEGWSTTVSFVVS